MWCVRSAGLTRTVRMVHHKRLVPCIRAELVKDAQVVYYESMKRKLKI
jgi:hypothetical protein